MKILKNIFSLERLSKTDKKIIDYVENNPELFCCKTIGVNADKIEVAPSSITKFIKKYYSVTYKEFVLIILESSLNISSPKSLNKSKYISDYVENSIHSINQMSTQISYENIFRAKDFIETAEVVCTFGEGMSKIAAISLMDDLNFIGKNIYNANSLLDLASWVDKEHKNNICVVLFSKSLNNKQIISIIKQLSKSNISVIIITANKDVKFLNNTIVINYETILHINKWGDYSSKTIQLFICGLIINLFPEYKNHERTTFLEEYINNIKNKIS